MEKSIKENMKENIFENIELGEKLKIQCYKHDGTIHRSWDEAVVLKITKDYIVCGNERTMVNEANKSVWKTKEPAIMYFFKDKWYNIIAQLKPSGISYYCNIASPFIIEDGTIKYIDYDLDLRIFSSGSFKVLDRNEYNYHKKLMKYPDDLDLILKHSLSELINDYRNGEPYFNTKKNLSYEKIYQNYKKIQN